MSEGQLSEIACSKCGELLYEGDVFCGNCGNKVPHCAKCDSILPDGAEFCIKCGSSAVKKCPKCGAAQLSSAEFCLKCGTKLEQDESAGSAASASNVSASASAPSANAAAPAAKAPSPVASAPVSVASSSASAGEAQRATAKAGLAPTGKASVSKPQQSVAVSSGTADSTASGGNSRNVGVILAILFCVGLLCIAIVSSGKNGSSAPPESSQAAQVSSESAANNSESQPNTSLSSADYVKGSYVTFGKYPQNNGDTPEPIEWLVLDNDGKTALVVSKYGLDCKPFHHEWVDISWRDCDLRKWLNGEFMDRAFSNEERKQIAESVINTADNPVYGTKGCWDTRDKVFCLSIEEAKKYFASGDARKCQSTSYAVEQGVFKSGTGCCGFWLRSPGNSTYNAADVEFDGRVHTSGTHVSYVDDGNAVRPALRIIL